MTRIMIESQIDERIRTFSSAVREALNDLPAEDVDELVDGLEADLADQAADLGGDQDLGDPAAYAAELRAAAGLPVRANKAAGRRRKAGHYWRGQFARFRAWMHSSRFGTWLWDTLIALRPVWWIARGWAAYTLLILAVWAAQVLTYPVFGDGGNSPWVDALPGFPGGDALGWLVLAAVILLSVQWGRGRWAPVGWCRATRTVVSVITAVVLPVLLIAAIGSAQSVLSYANLGYYSEGNADVPGLTMDGERIRNIYAYDASGKPIDAVQLFDQDGRPLNTVGLNVDPEMRADGYFSGGGAPLPVAHVGPGLLPVWNIYPLDQVPVELQNEHTVNHDENGVEQVTVPDELTGSTFPFPSVPAVGPSPSPSSSPSAAPSPAPTPTATPTVEP